MINETMYGLGNAPSAIRELFAYGLERKAEIGEDKVFDFSIGNPSVPAPDKVAKPCMSWPICLLLSYTRIPCFWLG